MLKYINIVIPCIAWLGKSMVLGFPWFLKDPTHKIWVWTLSLDQSKMGPESGSTFWN